MSEQSFADHSGDLDSTRTRAVPYVPRQRPTPRAELPDLPPRPRRTTGTRVAMLLGVLVVEAIGAALAYVAMLPANVTAATGSDYWHKVSTAALLGALIVLGAHLVAFAFLSPLVSYRHRDALLLLVPLVSVVFYFRVVWRLTALPERYWPARPDEPEEWPVESLADSLSRSR